MRYFLALARLFFPNMITTNQISIIPYYPQSQVPECPHNSFPSLSEIINAIRDKSLLTRYPPHQMTPDKIFFIETVTKLYSTPMGEKLCNVLKILSIKIPVIFNNKQQNTAIHDYLTNQITLYLDLFQPLFTIVESDGKQYLQYMKKELIIFHEFIHIIQFLQGPLPTISTLDTKKWSTPLEYLAINGCHEEYPLSENSLRKYLNLPRRVSHLGCFESLKLNVFSNETLLTLLRLNLTGDLEVYLKHHKPSWDTMFNSPILSSALITENDPFAKMIFHTLSQMQDNPQEYIQKAAETFAKTARFIPLRHMLRLNLIDLYFEVEGKPFIYFYIDTFDDQALLTNWDTLFFCLTPFLKSSYIEDPEKLLNACAEKNRTFLHTEITKRFSNRPLT